MRVVTRAIALAALSLAIAVPQARADLIGTGATHHYTWQEISKMGKLSSHNWRLYPGCHSGYAWYYTINPPAGYHWEVDVFISGPNGREYATNGLLEGADGFSGTRHYRLCSAVAPSGRYKITSTMNLWGPDGAPQTAHLAAVYYYVTKF